MSEKKTVQDKYGFVVEVPVGPVEQLDGGIAGGLKNMWNTVLKPNPALWAELDRLPPDEMLKHRMLKSLIRECGVPERLRAKFWPLISGANDLQVSSRVVYSDIINTLKSYKNESSDQIEKDLSRSFPGHPFFESPQGRRSLQNVLTAFSWLNPAIGYTQSMNFWVGLMLIFIPEEKCFWLLATIVERILPQQYYDQSMLDIIVDNQILFFLLEQYLPKVHQHISQYTTDLSPILTQWFLCLFVNTLPTELTLRILDCFLYEGNKILLRVALGIFKCYESEILKTESFEDLFMLIAKPFKIQDVTGFMALIFDRIWLRAFGREKLSQLRESVKKATIEQQLAMLEKRRTRAAANAAANAAAASSGTPTSPTSSSPIAEVTASSSTHNPKRRTIRASQLPPEVASVIDRKSWRAYKRSADWHMIEEYFSTMDMEEVGKVVIAPPPNSDERVPASVINPEGVPKATKTHYHFKATTIGGSTAPPGQLTSTATSPWTSSHHHHASTYRPISTAQKPATETNKRRSYADVAKEGITPQSSSGDGIANSSSSTTPAASTVSPRAAMIIPSSTVMQEINSGNTKTQAGASSPSTSAAIGGAIAKTTIQSQSPSPGSANSSSPSSSSTSSPSSSSSSSSSTSAAGAKKGGTSVRAAASNFSKTVSNFVSSFTRNSNTSSGTVASSQVGAAVQAGGASNAKHGAQQAGMKKTSATLPPGSKSPFSSSSSSTTYSHNTHSATQGSNLTRSATTRTTTTSTTATTPTARSGSPSQHLNGERFPSEAKNRSKISKAHSELPVGPSTPTIRSTNLAAANPNSSFQKAAISPSATYAPSSRTTTATMTGNNLVVPSDILSGPAASSSSSTSGPSNNTSPQRAIPDFSAAIHSVVPRPDGLASESSDS